ncbi:MAG: hypothetical protein JKY37_24725 [Nannocystaceae bacterium]|nr:hypothetical protein [Nannocystaceae bacterium]
MTHLDKDKIWIWGVSRKKPDAIAELMRLVGIDPSSGLRLQFAARIDELAVERLPRRRAGFAGSHTVLQFGAVDLAVLAGGLVVRARERGILFKEVVIEDHGVGPNDPAMPNNPTGTFLFFGGDGVSLQTIARHSSRFQLMRQAMAPDARLVLMHCWAFSDGGKLALEISRLIDRPVVGMNGYQIVDDQKIQGPIFQAYRGRVSIRQGMSPWIVNFD